MFQNVLFATMVAIASISSFAAAFLWPEKEPAQEGEKAPKIPDCFFNPNMKVGHFVLMNENPDDSKTLDKMFEIVNRNLHIFEVYALSTHLGMFNAFVRVLNPPFALQPNAERVLKKIAQIGNLKIGCVP